MVDLGFTIIPHDQEFFDRIQAFAPPAGVADVNGKDAEILADAYHRYSFLIGLVEPFDDFEAAKLGMDAQDFPDLVDSRAFVYEHAARLMLYWTGLSQASVYAYLYEESVFIAACGLLEGMDEVDCKQEIATYHADWFGPASLRTPDCQPQPAQVTDNSPLTRPAHDPAKCSVVVIDPKGEFRRPAVDTGAGSVT